MISRYVIKEWKQPSDHWLDSDRLVFKIYDRKNNWYSFSYYFSRTEAEKYCLIKNQKG